MKPDNNWFLSVASPMLAYWMMEIAIRLRDAHNNGPAIAYAQEVFGQHTQSWYRDRTPLCPAFMVREYTGCLEISIDGPSGLQGYANFVEAFGDTRPTLINAHANDMSREIFTYIQERVEGDRKNILLHGHSQGSTIALALALRMKNAYRDALVRCITFGGPKCLRGAIVSEYDAIHVTRWITINDPVPLIPVTTATPAIAAAQVGLRELREWSSWVHIGSVGVLDGGSVVTARTQPDYDPSTVPGGVAGWLSSMALMRTSAHSQQTYSDFLYAVATAGVERNHTQTPAIAAAQVEEMPPQAIQRAVRQSTERLRRAEILQLQTPAHVPDVWRWRYEKVGGVFNVYWGPYLTMSTMRRRNASAVVKWGNRWQSAIQRKPVVERASLVEALAHYLTEAADPQSGFTPTMNVAS